MLLKVVTSYVHTNGAVNQFISRVCTTTMIVPIFSSRELELEVMSMLLLRHVEG